MNSAGTGENSNNPLRGMSDKKQPDNVTHAFMEKVNLSERQNIRLAIEQLAKKDPSIKTGYDSMLARQEQSLRVIKAHQKKQRDKEVQRTKGMLLDDNDPNKVRKPVYKPRFGHGVKRSELEKLAENDALGIVLQNEQHRIAVVEKKFTEGRLQYLSDAIKELQQHTEKFNRSAGNLRSRERSENQSQDRGYDR